MTIPVICDRCRVAGTAGSGDFSQFGDLLEFEPVPRRPRVNGWDAEAQRAFIALLAVTGSKRRAAKAIGRNAFGVDQLLKAEGNDSFKAAFDRAMAIAKQNGAMKLATGVADAAARNSMLTPPSRLRDLASPPRGRGRIAEGERGEGETSDDEHERLSISLLRKYLLKVQQERTARLAGKIVEADFYLRQVTFFEVAIDLAQDRSGTDTWTWLSNLRRDGNDLFDIAQTDFGRFLDEARRMTWSGEIDPREQRPEHPPKRYLVERSAQGVRGTPEHWRDGYSLEPGEVIHGGPGISIQRQMAEQEERHRREAVAQIQWEQQATSLFPNASSQA